MSNSLTGQFLAARIAIAISCVAVGSLVCSLPLHTASAIPPEMKVVDYSARFQTPSVQLHLGPGKSNTTLLFVSRPGHADVTITLPLVPEGDVTTFTAVKGGKIVVTLDADEGAILLSILDIRLATITNQFMCYQPVISPDGRYIAFTQFFPLHGVNAEQASNFKNVYDIMAGSHNAVASRDDGDIFKSQGQLVYPTQQKLSISRRYSRPIVHTFPAAPIWAADSSKFAFIDNVFPADPISLGALHDGNLQADASVPPAAAARLILIRLDEGEWRARQFDTDVCMSGSSFCGTYLRSAVFSASGVRVDVGKILDVPFAAFLPVKAGR